MKFWKSFSFFFIYPFSMLVLGFLGGVFFMDTFYPASLDRFYEGLADALASDGRQAAWEAGTAYGNPTVDGEGTDGTSLAGAWTEEGLMDGAYQEADTQGMASAGKLPTDQASTGLAKEGQDGAGAQDMGEDSQEVLAYPEKLNADTAYVLEETDLIRDSVVETTWKLPAKYIGMDREEFLDAMDSYEASPPLSELERGFVGLEVLSFSKDRVVVQMNYEYVQPSSSFFLVVEDNYVVVYLEDRETVYMYTDILLTDLPDGVQQDVINWLYMPDEESLYNFLESYSS